MISVPSYEEVQIRPFRQTDTAYAGPTSIKRKAVEEVKRNIKGFVYLQKMSIHIEIVNDLISKVFLSAFKRFMKRRRLIRH